METTFNVLNQIHGDLLEVAARERARRASGGSGRRPPTKLVAAAVVILAAAGLVGAIARSDIHLLQGSNDSGGAAVAGSTGGSSSGASGSTGPARNPVPHSVPGSGEPSQPIEPRIIRTADLSLVIPRDDFEQRFGEAVDVAERYDGYVQDSTSRDRSGSVTIRVPSSSFDETMRALRQLGTVDVQSVRGQDVTSDSIDLQARLRIARSRREVLLGLMADAKTISQTIHVQNALDATQLRIEELQGQLRVLDDRTTLATITLRMREQGVQAQVEKPSIPNALERAVAGFVGVIAAIVIGFGYLLPLLLITAVVWLVVWRLRRHRT